MLKWQSLISEDMKSLSLGRVAFWIALSYSTWFWFISTSTFPSALLEFLYATLGYNLGTKGVSAYQRVKTGLLPTLTPQDVQYTSTNTVSIQSNMPPQDDLTEEDLNMTKGK